MVRDNRHTYRPRPAKVIKIIDEAPGIKTFRLRFEMQKDRKRFSFLPGQFGLFSLMGIGEATFSMCSPPRQKDIEISVRNVGDVTNAMFSMQKGDVIGVRGPYGKGFPVGDIKGKDIVIVAGGIGFPPLASAVEYIIQRRKNYGKVYVYYGVHAPEDIVYRYKKERWLKSGIKIFTTVEKKTGGWRGPVGLVTDGLKKLKLADVQNAAGLSCGPPIMLKFVSQELRTLGLEPDSIFLSLERLMQCGIGKCGHCNIGDKYVCRDGPVFSLSELRYMQEDVW